jgi:hypothetical protein
MQRNPAGTRGRDLARPNGEILGPFFASGRAFSSVKEALGVNQTRQWPPSCTESELLIGRFEGPTCCAPRLGCATCTAALHCSITAFHWRVTHLLLLLFSWAWVTGNMRGRPKMVARSRVVAAD